MTTENIELICPFCKEKNNADAVVCIKCGTELIGRNQKSDKPETIVVESLSRDYDIIEIIGKGGMATVYKALHKRLNRLVALKVIHQNLIHDEDLVSRFIAEAQICASLNHRNIITVHDIGIIGSVYFIAMEYLEGRDLFNIIRKQEKLNFEDALKWISPIVDALSYMHKLGYIHRDVKSANIFITNDGRPVLMDFGIVHSGSNKTISASADILGTPEYMSPEQAAGNVEMDNRSDIYSLGIVLYEAVTGQVPFKGENFLTTLHQVVNDQPKPPIEINRKIPRWFNEVILACLQKNREFRYANAQALNDMLNNQGVNPVRNKTKGEKILLSAIVLVFLGVIFVGVYFFILPKESSIQASEIDIANNITTTTKTTNTAVPVELAQTKNSNSGKQTPPDLKNEVIGNSKQNDKESSVSISKNEPSKVEKSVEKKIEEKSVSQSNQILPLTKSEVGFRLNSSQLDHLEILGISLVLVKGGNSGLTDFYIFKTEVTQSVWEKIMSSNPSLFKGSNRPIENIELSEINQFIQRLKSQTGLNFRLPTVQEWTFAASGGTEKKGYTYSGGNILDNCAWYEENSSGETKAVGTKSGNELGIRDMSGNVWERCQGNIICGGSYLSTSSSCSVNSIKSSGSNQKDNTIGFRLVISN